jgi:hypothetical protein
LSDYKREGMGRGGEKLRECAQLGFLVGLDISVVNTDFVHCLFVHAFLIFIDFFIVPTENLMKSMHPHGLWLKKMLPTYHY